MPYKSEKIKIAGTAFDRRRKLNLEQEKEIKEIYSQGGISTVALAKKYNVSKTTILNIVNEKCKERAKAYKKEHWKDWGRTKEDNAKYMRSYRNYKQKLYLNGDIKTNIEENNK